MKRFYFHVLGDVINFNDDEGAEFSNLEAAHGEAELALRELVVNAIRASNDHVAEAIVVNDEAGREVLRVALQTVLPRNLRAL
jgi:hypothetical protein